MRGIQGKPLQEAVDNQEGFAFSEQKLDLFCSKTKQSFEGPKRF